MRIAYSLLAAFTLACPNWASAELISFKTYKLKPPSIADNFEAEIGDGKFTSATSDVVAFPATGLNTKKVKFKTENLIAPTREVTFTFKFENYSGETFKAFWTFGDNKIGDDVLAATQSLFDETYLVGNDDDEPLLVNDLAFATNVAAFDIDLDDPNSLSFGPAIDLLLPVGATTAIGLGPLDPETLVVAHGFFQVGDAEPFEFLAVQQVPEPWTIALVGIGLLAAARRRIL